MKAAPITWSTATTIAGDTDVLNVGASAYAYNWNNSTQTVNSVTFTGTNSSTSGGSGITLSGFTGGNVGNNTFGSTAAPYTNLSAAYKLMLGGGNYTNAATAVTVTLNSLSIGHLYVAQFWVDDSRAGFLSRTETLTSSGGNTVTLNYTTTNSAGGLGSYSYGNFTADATTQAFTVTGNSSTQINALQVRDVTGAWSGQTDGNLDNATANFTNSASFSSITSLAVPVTAIYFGDTDGFRNAVINNNVIVQAAGISIANLTVLNGTVNYTFSNASGNTGITGATAITKSGTGTLTLNSANSYTGITTLVSGTLNINNNSALGTNYLSITAAATIDNTSGDAVSITNIPNISNNTNVTFSGSNPLTFANGINLVTGGTTVTFTVNGSSVVTIGTSGTTSGILNHSVFTNTVGTSDGGGGIVFTKAGSGTLTIAGASKYGGGKTINLTGGTLNINNNGALQSFGNNGGNTFNISANTVIDNTSAAAVSIAAGQSGLAIMNWNGDFTFGGTRALTFAANVNLSANRQVTVNGTGALTLTGAIATTGSGFSLTKVGSGTMAIQAASTGTGMLNANAGLVTINGSGRWLGNVNVGSGGTFQNTGAGTDSMGAALTVSSGGVFDNQQTGTETVSSFSLAGTGIGGTGAWVNNASGTTAGALTATGGISLAADTTIGGPGNLSTPSAISGSYGLTKAGAGTVTLSGANTYIGATSVTAGTLKFTTQVSLYNNTTANWTAANIQVGSGATLALNVGGTGEFTTGDIATLLTNIDGAVSSNGLQAGSFLAFDTTNASGGAFTISIAIADTTGTGGGAVGLTKLGTNTLILSGVNTYTGATTVSAGTLQFANQVSLYNNATANWTAANITVASGATLAFNVGGTGEFTTTDVTTLLTNLDRAVSSNGLQAGSFIAFDTTNASGGTFAISTVIANTTGTGGGAVGLTKLGTNTLTLSGANTYTGTTTVSAGTLSLTGIRIPGTQLSVASGATLEYNNSAGLTQSTLTLTGTGTIRKTGAGQLIFGGQGTINWNLSAGALIDIQQGTAILGSNNQDVWTSNNSSLNIALNAVANSVEASLRLDALTGAGTLMGGYQPQGPSTDTLGVANGSGTFSGVIANSNLNAGSVLNITKTGTGTQVFSGANTYTGVTSITGGILQFAKTASLYNSNTASWTAANIKVASGGTFAINVDTAGTNGFTAANVTTLLTNLGGLGASLLAGTGLGAGSAIAFDTSTATGSTFTLSNNITNSTGAGGGAIGVTKLGTNTLVFDGINSYTGPTNVNGGKLLINGNNSSTTGAVTVNTTGTLGGTGGTIGGAVSVIGGVNPGTITSGTVSGATMLNLGSTLTLADGARQQVSIFSNTMNDASQVVVAGNVTYGALNGAKVTLDLSAITPAGMTSATTYTILTSGGGTGIMYNGTPTIDFANSINPNGFDSSSFTLDSSSSTSLVLNYAPVPEPGTILGIAALGLGLASRFRRRRNA